MLYSCGIRCKESAVFLILFHFLESYIQLWWRPCITPPGMRLSIVALAYSWHWCRRAPGYAPSFADCPDAAHVQPGADFGLLSIGLFQLWRRYIFLHIRNGQLQTVLVSNVCLSSSQQKAVVGAPIAGVSLGCAEDKS